MSNLTMEQLRAAFNKPAFEGPKFTNNYYPFWDMNVGESATVRFLPDKNNENPLGFIIEKKQHKLTINGKDRKVPCLDMYGEKCPICQLSREYYKAKDEANGKKYYRTVQYIAQAIVVNNPLPVNEEEGDPTGKVKLIAMGKQIYKNIKDTFESGELDQLPYDYERGTDFIIKKDKQGEYASYSLSKFARRERALDEDTIASIELVDLRTVLPKNPGLDKVQAMLEADMTGEAYDDGNTAEADADVDADAVQSSVAAAKPAAKPITTSKPAVNKAEESNDTEDTGNEVLARLRSELAARRKS